MPHEHITLAQAPNGEIGPRCENCGIRLTFGNAMVVGKYYMCWEHMSKQLVQTLRLLLERLKNASG